MVTATARTLFDRDTSPGAEPEDLLQLDIPALIIPGRDPSHATSAARYLEECLPRSEYWDVLPRDKPGKTPQPRLRSSSRKKPCKTRLRDLDCTFAHFIRPPRATFGPKPNLSRQP